MLDTHTKKNQKQKKDQRPTKKTSKYFKRVSESVPT